MAGNLTTFSPVTISVTCVAPSVDWAVSMLVLCISAITILINSTYIQHWRTAEILHGTTAQKIIDIHIILKTLDLTYRKLLRSRYIQEPTLQKYEIYPYFIERQMSINFVFSQCSWVNNKSFGTYHQVVLQEASDCLEEFIVLCSVCASVFVLI
jgi:hypothetical protein